MQLPASIGQRLQQIRIAAEDLANEGRETDPHITVKYGLHTADVAGVRAALQGERPIQLRLGKTSIFPRQRQGAPTSSTSTSTSTARTSIGSTRRSPRRCRIPTRTQAVSQDRR